MEIIIKRIMRKEINIKDNINIKLWKEIIKKYFDIFNSYIILFIFLFIYYKYIKY